MRPSRDKLRQDLRVVLPLTVVFLVILLLHARHYWPFLSDDALISFRYAQRLLAGKGLTWTDGPPVEGYSNLLWLLLTALLGAMRIDMIAASRMLGVAGMTLAMVAVLRWAVFSRPFAAAWPGTLTGLLFFTLAAPVAAWTIGGLEQPLVAGLLAVAIAGYWSLTRLDRPARGQLLAVSLPLGLLCITRPDGPLFTAAFVLSAVICRAVFRQHKYTALAVWLPVIPVLLTGGQLLFRLAYYHQWVPNPALVKISPSLHFLREGTAYVGQGLYALAPFSLLALLFLIFALLRKHRLERALPLALILGLWLAYLIVIGGDIFPASRHFLPVIVVFTFTLVEGVGDLWEYLRNSTRFARSLALAGILLLFFPYILLQFSLQTNRNAVTERWEWDGQALAIMLKRVFSRQQPLLAVTAAGCLPYWSGLPCLDMLGLNDDYLPRHRPANFGQGMLGHELGSGDYILRRGPDIVCFDIAKKDFMFRTGMELANSEAFWTQYTPVFVRVPGPREFTGKLWINRESRRIGIRRWVNEIVIPGYLFTADPPPTAFVSGDRLVVPVSAGHPVGVPLPGITPDRWNLEVRGEGANRIRALSRVAKGVNFLLLVTDSPQPCIVEEVILHRRGSG